MASSNNCATCNTFQRDINNAQKDINNAQKDINNAQKDINNFKKEIQKIQKKLTKLTGNQKSLEEKFKAQEKEFQAHKDTHQQAPPGNSASQEHANGVQAEEPRANSASPQQDSAIGVLAQVPRANSVSQEHANEVQAEEPRVNSASPQQDSAINCSSKKGPQIRTNTKRPPSTRKSLSGQSSQPTLDQCFSEGVQAEEPRVNSQQENVIGVQAEVPRVISASPQQDSAIDRQTKKRALARTNAVPASKRPRPYRKSLSETRSQSRQSTLDPFLTRGSRDNGKENTVPAMCPKWTGEGIVDGADLTLGPSSAVAPATINQNIKLIGLCGECTTCTQPKNQQRNRGHRYNLRVRDVTFTPHQA